VNLDRTRPRLTLPRDNNLVSVGLIFTVAGWLGLARVAFDLATGRALPDGIALWIVGFVLLALLGTLY
jgi:hypothetical protein